MKGSVISENEQGLEVQTLAAGLQNWVIVGAETVHLCTGPGRLRVHGCGTQVRAGNLLLLARGTRYQLTAPSERMRVRNRALAQNLATDGWAWSVLRAACRWSEEHNFRLPVRGKTRAKLEDRFRAYCLAEDPLERKGAFFLFIAALGQVVPHTDSSFRPEGSAASIRTLLTYISEKYADPIPVADALAVTGLSRSHFHVAFRQATGTTFQQYLTRFRINEACQQLLHFDHSIAEIAYACGFGSISAFYEAFKRVSGTSPERYRSHKD